MTDRLEQDLRRVLRDPHRSPTPAPDTVERIRTGMARRRARRRAAAVAAAVLAVAAVAGVSALLTRHARPVPAGVSPGVVPWLDAPVAPYSPPPPPTVPRRPTAASCRGADLRLSGVDGEGATGHTGTFVHVQNTGSP